nr:MAG TPA: hypothetical protein [Caudoviricetes sp.]
MLMLILKIISILCLVGVAVTMFMDSYNNDCKSVANSLIMPLFILFGAIFLAMLYVG